MFFGIATATCDYPGNSCHINYYQQADGEVYRRVRLTDDTLLYYCYYIIALCNIYNSTCMLLLRD